MAWPPHYICASLSTAGHSTDRMSCILYVAYDAIEMCVPTYLFYGSFSAHSIHP